uniref:phospholipase A2 group V-like isoform X2 n=1 Tax=Myodes glareolus TaxID=447135 RepID=UPI002021044D|nr:phospholipase A2 group V-like isoform X2 [Myodes glareolus]
MSACATRPGLQCWGLNSGLQAGTQEMKGLLILAWFLVCSVPAVPGGFIELRSMIDEVTGMDPILDFGFYGCYCGFGGKGMPKDNTDWCCWAHDRCYGELEKKGCDIRFQSYDYRVTGGLVTCEYGSYCSTRLCDCDRTLVYCLRRNLWNYNPDYQFYPNFLC